MTWLSMDIAPRDGTEIELLGKHRNSEITEVVTGSYESGGYTEGWIDERGNWFFPTHWRKKNDNSRRD